MVDLAGTGKTAIAHSVAKRCHEARLLPSSFFFDRDVPDSALHRVPGKPQCRLVVQCTSLHPAYRTMNECILAVCTCVSDPILFLLELPVNRPAHIPLPPFSDCSQLTYHHASSFWFIPPLIPMTHYHRLYSPLNLCCQPKYHSCFFHWTAMLTISSLILQDV